MVKGIYYFYNITFFHTFVLFYLTSAMKRLTIFISHLIIIVTLMAQPLCQITEFTAEDGLPQDIASGVLQDRKGFIWICTRNGLNKFDGYTFKNYKSVPSKEHSLSSNRITFISETEYGDIWCQTYDNRAYIFDTHRETFFDVLKPVEKEMQRKNLVQKIYPLKEGIAWLICDKGHCYRVNEKKYNKKEGVSLYSTFNGKLKGEHIFAVYQDVDKDEWILTDKGISIIGEKKIDSDFPFKFIKEYKGKIYLASTSEKLACYDPQTESMSFFDIPQNTGKINAFEITSKGTLVIATNNGVVLFNPEDKNARTIDIRSSTQPTNEATFIYEDKAGEIWIFPNGTGIIRFNPATGEQQHLYTPEKEVIHYGRETKNIIFEDKQGTLWLTPNKGSFCYYDRKNKQLKMFYTDYNNPQSLFAPLVRYFYQDRQGNYWLLSIRGIKKMSFYPQVYTSKDIDRGFETRAFLLDSSKQLWVASKSEYIRIYDANGNLSGYLSPQGRVSKEKVAFQASVYSFCEGEDGTIWIGTKGKGLIRLTRKTGDSYAIQYYTHAEEDPYSLSNNDIYCIHPDSKNNIWVGCYGGGLNLLQQTPEGKVYFINHRNKLKNYPSGTCHNIRYITEVENGTMLIGTTYGLLSFSNSFAQPEEIKFYRNGQNNDSYSSLMGNDVMHIYQDSRKDIYILTFTGGVNKVISKNLLSENIEFQYYTMQEGLSSDMVLSMIEDSKKNLWIVSENALSKFNSQTESFENYDTKFLRQKLNFTEAIPIINASQELIFGTDIGFLEIVPEQMKKSNYVPPIVFTSLRINGKKLDVTIDDLKEIDLHHSERNINVQFSALDYTRPEDIRYAYRLEGVEKEWNYSDKNRHANYINLPAGEYQLHVKSTNSEGVWVNNSKTLTIRVIPTFWETPWAWSVYLFAFILFTGIILYVFLYIYRLRHQVDMEQQLANVKLKFFTDISHELRTPLTLISSPVSEVLEDPSISPSVREHLTIVHKNTERMLRLVNQILDFRKIQNKKMKLLVENTELIAFLMKITESFRLIAEERQINFTFQSELEELYIWIDRDKVEKIIFNLLSNAFKYTLPGKDIKIAVQKSDNNIRVSIIDEGIGIAPDKMSSLFKRFETLSKSSNILQPSSGIGLSLVKELVDMHHGNIEVKSQPGTGSEFSVSLPLDRQIFEKDEQAELILTDSSDSAAETVVSTENVILKPDGDPEELLSILIVEDNRELRNLLRNILSKKYSVLEAANGEEGLRLAAEAIPDMIISDVMMPVMDGLEMIGHIKENKDIYHIPIILLSAKASLDDRITAIEQGIDDYITKPFSSSYLKARIASLFTKRKQLQEIFMNKLSAVDRMESSQNWEPTEPDIMPHDKLFMKEVMEFLEEQMDNPDLIIDDFANKLHLSRSIFYRKLKSIVGMPPVDFIREIRVKRAAQLIKNDSFNFSQIAYMTGFSDPKYFSRCFKKYMGCTPSEYKNTLDKEKLSDEKTN